MRRLWRMVAGTAIVLMMALAVTATGQAVTGPLPQQWWFAAWAVNNEIWPTAQGQGVTVAVSDTGVQADVPDLAGAVLPGKDFTGGGGDGRTDTDIAEVAGHGTGMASLIVSQGRGTGFMGVAPKAKVLPLVTDDTDSGDQAIRYAVDHGAKIINISQAAYGTCLDSTQQAADYAVQKGAIVVASAGNFGLESNPAVSPADCSGVLAVGSIDNQLKAWSGTERQPYVAVAAPGVDVGGVLKDGQVHTADGGTSPAAALTSGGIALLWSEFPHESRTDILKRVFASLRDVGPKGKDDATGYGAFRPARALGATVPNSAAYNEWASHNRSGSGRVLATPTKLDDQGESHGTSKINLSVLSIVLLVPVIGLIVAVSLAVLRSRQRRRQQVPAFQAQLGLGEGIPGYHWQGPPRTFGPPQHQGPPYGGAAPTIRPPLNQGPPPGHG